MVHFSVLVPIVPILRSKWSQKLLRKTSLHSRRTLGMLIVKLRYQKKMFSIALGVEPGLCFIFLSNYLMPPYRSRLITPFHVHDPIRSWIVTPTSSWTNKSETMHGKHCSFFETRQLLIEDPNNLLTLSITTNDTCCTRRIAPPTNCTPIF